MKAKTPTMTSPDWNDPMTLKSYSWCINHGVTIGAFATTQGYSCKTWVIEVTVNGKTTTHITGTETDGTGELSVDEYDQAVRDLTNFLEYVGEPTRLESEALGIKVLGFLVIQFILAFMLKKEYWRDVH